jgi:hypothetical protein
MRASVFVRLGPDGLHGVEHDLSPSTKHIDQRRRLAAIGYVARDSNYALV